MNSHVHLKPTSSLRSFEGTKALSIPIFQHADNGALRIPYLFQFPTKKHGEEYHAGIHMCLPSPELPLKTNGGCRSLTPASVSRLNPCLDFERNLRIDGGAASALSACSCTPSQILFPADVIRHC